jgi:hypothetical protein
LPLKAFPSISVTLIFLIEPGIVILPLKVLAGFITPFEVISK